MEILHMKKFVSFPEFVTSIDTYELYKCIYNEYKQVKYNSDYIPCMGEYGSFEFAGALLLWRYLKESVCILDDDSRIKEFCNGMLFLSYPLGAAFFGTPPGIWSDIMDDMIPNVNNIIVYSEWNEVYNYLKENLADEIHELEFNMGAISEDTNNFQKNIEKEQKRISLYKEFTKVGNMGKSILILDYFDKKELNIKGQLPLSLE